MQQQDSHELLRYLLDNMKTEEIKVIHPELQVTGGIEINSKIIFLFLNKNVCCDPSLEPSLQDGSNDG